MDWAGIALIFSLMVLGWAIYASTIRQRGLLIADSSLRGLEAGRSGEIKPESRLTRWLSLAGYRDPAAAERFVYATAGCLLLAMALAWLFDRSGAIAQMEQVLTAIPGGAGEFLLAVAQLGPFIVLALVTCVPWLIVRAARRQRVAQVEKDLPLMMDLFATLAEAGLGFDTALERILESQAPDRALPREFRIYQRDALSGVPRVQGLRRLAKRIDVPAMTTFLSAVIEAEQIGASLAETLRHQAEDLRDRRRARAMLIAQALPVKLVFPLILCFLPGIFVSTLAPAVYQMIRVVDSVIPRR